MSERLKAACDSAYLQGIYDGRLAAWTDAVRAVGVLAGDIHDNQEAQRVLHVVQERLEACHPLKQKRAAS